MRTMLKKFLLWWANSFPLETTDPYRDTERLNFLEHTGMSVRQRNNCSWFCVPEGEAIFYDDLGTTVREAIDIAMSKEHA
jgi:hypothetical protein